MTEHLIFKIGRGGHFNNQNHLSFIGVGNLDNEIADLNIKYEYMDNIPESIFDCVVEQLTYDVGEDEELIDKFDLGLLQVHDDNCVMEDYAEYLKTGLGVLDYDGEYNTLYTCGVKELIKYSDREIRILIESASDLDVEVGMVIFGVDEETFTFLVEQDQIENLCEIYKDFDDLLYNEYDKLEEPCYYYDVEYKNNYYIKH